VHPQHKIVAQILFDKGADYLLPIKGNEDNRVALADSATGWTHMLFLNPPYSPRPRDQRQFMVVNNLL